MKSEPFDKAKAPLLCEKTVGGKQIQKNFSGRKRSSADPR
jgi:hypothetical protein